MSLFSSNEENYPNPSEEYHIDRHYAGVQDRFEPENEYGNVEYKLKLVNPTPARFEKLCSQLKWRMAEGQGVAVVVVGIRDDGRLWGLTKEEIRQSMETLNSMANKISATTTIVRTVNVELPPMGSRGVRHDRKRPAPGISGTSTGSSGSRGRSSNSGNNISRQNNNPTTNTSDNRHTGETAPPIRQVLEVIVRKNTRHDLPDELRAAVLGPSDSGKSTLLGVLSHSSLDNGRGSARLSLFRHRHELKSGHTSSISQEVFGFTSKGEALTYNLCLSTEELIESADRIITLIDLAGHQRFLATTLFGLCSHSPDILMLVANAASSISPVTHEHISIALGMENLLVTIINKIDLTSPDEQIECCNKLERIFTSPHLARQPLRITDTSLAIQAAQTIRSHNLAPIFFTSCVTGEGLHLLNEFLFRLAKSTHHLDGKQLALHKPSEMQIYETYTVPGTGKVVSGLVSSGVIRDNDKLLLGPDDKGEFTPVAVMSIQRHKIACSLAKAGQFCTLAIKAAPQQAATIVASTTTATNHQQEQSQQQQQLTQLSSSNAVPRKGMVIRANDSDWKYSFPICIYFQAKIETIVNHHHKIRVGSQMSVYVGAVRQTAKIVSISGNSRNSTVVFKFKRPEYVRPGSRLIFRHGLAKGIGYVLKVYNYAETLHKSIDSIIQSTIKRQSDEDSEPD